MRIVAMTVALLAAVILAPATAAYAQAHQGPDLAAQRAAMERIAGMAGDWRGEANVTFPATRTVHQNEHIERDMNGLLLVIHGNGYATADRTGAPIFNALGVISYDDARQIYEFRVYNDGRAATAEAHFLDDGRLQWTMNFSPVIIRYTITLGANTWNEIGEMSRDNGATWTQTIEMNLTRIQ
ncbi:hypothetical protein [Terricaulis silvestris]|uniref:DUF1579 domain-containing protein n=1 Tax=Terricaulis silvestris TaxID=2686094 RepID=A0A6I6MI65_9CAUL|nr:hypothetical protein [Terricaulis silvestris]QGZ94710.1 hypothetical protein DSM104635_01540 [Terricaulis silvestris]